MAEKHSMSSTKKKHYRQDIQGLRGIAVLLVVLYHTDLVFSGGYIGVDVFFVLSGFVIAQVLLRELQKSGRVDLKRFYEKRFRRLLPAAALCTMVTLVGVVIFMSPTGPQQFAIRTAMAAALFGSNLYLFRGGGYFDSAAEANPFLHMWSLSVEEQFYFVLPITMALVWMWAASRKNKSKNALSHRPISVIVLVVLVGGMVSFLLSASLAIFPEHFPFDASSFGFFFPLTRVWEFSAGVLLALGAHRLPSLSSRMALWWGIAGAGFILFAGLAYDANTAFPGWAALLPVMGTILLLMAGESSKIVNKTLSFKPLCWMGNISYSWYLWHWPLIVFAPMIFPEAGFWLLPLAGFGAIIPAWLSYKYMEEPIRRNRALVGPAARRLTGICIISVIAVGAALSYGTSKDWGLNPPPGWSDLPVAFKLPCEGPLSEWQKDQCLFPAPEDSSTVDAPPILLVGDSHAGSLSDGVIAAGNELGYDVIIMWMPSCPFLDGRSIYNHYDCARWQKEVVEFIEETPLNLVVMSVYANNYVLSPHYLQQKVIETRDGFAPNDHKEALKSWGDALDDTLQTLEEYETPVLMAEPVPFYPHDPTLALSLFQPEPLIQELRPDELEARQSDISKVNQRVASRFDGATLFDPTPHICENNCSPVIDDKWLYLDPAHLNARGSMHLSNALKKAIQEALEENATAP